MKSNFDKARDAFIRDHRTKAYLSFHNGIYSYLNYFNSKIERNHVALFNYLLRYTVHDYIGAKNIETSIFKRRFSAETLGKINELFNDIDSKINKKNELINGNLPYKKKNVLLIFCETEKQDVFLWQKEVYSLAFECGVKDLGQNQRGDFFNYETITHNIIRMDTINYKDYEDFIKNVPKNADAIFIVAHGDLEEIPGINVKFGNVFINPTKINIELSKFCNSIYNQILNTEAMLVCFACGSNNLKSCAFKNYVRCGPYLDGLSIKAYTFSFLASLMFDDDFNTIRSRAKIIAQICSNNYEQVDC